MFNHVNDRAAIAAVVICLSLGRIGFADSPAPNPGTLLEFAETKYSDLTPSEKKLYGWTLSTLFAIGLSGVVRT